MHRAEDYTDDAEQVIRSIENRLRLTMSEVRLSERIDWGRVGKMRFSGLPFCPVKWFINLPVSVHEHEDKLVDFGYKFFTSVGHTVHDVIQTSIFHSQHIRALTDWKCTKCSKVYALRVGRPKACECGSRSFKREEHTVEWNGAVGHVDEIIDLGNKRVFILDYKTTSLARIKKEDPPGYLSQISSYAVALNDSGYTVVGYALVYVPRDNPFKFRVSPYVFDSLAYGKARKRLKKWHGFFGEAVKVATEEEALALLDSRPCKDSQPAAYGECPHRSICAGCGERPENMVFLVKESYKRVKTYLPISK